MTKPKIDLSQTCTQEAFGKMVGISQPAVSSLVKRGILLPGQSAQVWIWRYATHLREEIIARWSSTGSHAQ